MGSLLNQTYTDRDDALKKLIDWAVNATHGNGWTQEYSAAEGDGWRGHLSKTINSIDCFFNFRSSDGVEDISTSQGDVVAGIAVNGSSEYTGTGVAWDDQVGHTTNTYAGSTNIYGNADKLILTGGDCHFFSTPTNLTGVFQSESDTDDWKFITIGLLGTYPAYFASGGLFKDILAGSEGDYDPRSSYCSNTETQGTSNAPNASSAVYDGTGWFVNYNNRQGNIVTDILNNLIHGFTTGPNSDPGSLIMDVLHKVPDAFRGNAQLFPGEMAITKGTTNEFYPVGELEGIQFCNMTNYNNEQEITNGAGDTYKLFRIWNPGPMGVAFLV